MLKSQLLLLGVLMLLSSTTQFPIDDNYILKIDDVGNEVEIIEDTIRLLNDGRAELIYSNHSDNTYLVGTTGTGKTTLALVLTGDNSKLTSVDVGEEYNETLGSYFIRDDGNLIGNATITSKTILPQLFIDEISDNSYYDCPGYDDTRNSSVDITATFFIKDVVDYANRVKFVFVLNHDSVTTGGSRTAFLSLTEHIARFMKDINKYADGIATIINKVEQPHITTENTISAVAVFLKQTKAELVKNIDDKPYYKVAVAFIDILLHKTDNQYDRIQILRKPDRPGIVSEIPIVQDCRTAIHKMIYQDLTFVLKDNDDFGYTISDKSQNDVIVLGAGLSKQISQDVKAIDKIISDYYDKEEADKSLDMYELQDMFYDSYKAINDFIKSAKELDTVEKFMNEIKNTMNKINVPIPSNILQDLDTHVDFFNFLQKVSTIPIPVDSVQWASNLEESNTFLDTLSKFYSFLPKLYNDFISYEYQNNKKLYNVADLNDWGVADKPQGIEIKTDADWNLFISKSGYTEMKNTKLNAIEFERLNTVLKWTLRSTVEVNCNTGSKTLRVYGEVVLLSDVTSAKCYDDSKYIRIYAIISIIFNDVVEKTGKQVQLSVIAPTWNILAKTNNIVLSGGTGETTSGSPGNGESVGQSGKEGKPGGPGGNSGHFFGSGSVFVNGQDLKVILNGGVGGNGQNGGNGYVSTDKVIAPNGVVDNLDCDGRLSNYIYAKNGPVEVSNAVPGWLKPILELLPLKGDTTTRTQKYKLYGTCGGNGGSSGQGGIAGKAGIFDVISLYEDSKVNKEIKEGKAGNCGENGKAGKNSDVTSTHCESSYTYLKLVGFTIDIDKSNSFGDSTFSSTEANKFCSTLTSGTKCGGTAGLVTTNPIDPLDRQTPVEQFRLYFKANINDGLRKQTLETFLKRYNDATADIKYK